MSEFWRDSGWPVVRLSQVAELFSGGTPSRKRADFFSGKIPWLTGQDIPADRVADIESGRDWITEDAIKSSSTRLVPPGTVLITTRVTVGKVGIAGIPLCFSQDITGLTLRSTDLLLPHFLAYFLSAQRLKYLQRNQGSTITGITRDNLELERIPVPPLSEQERIVDILKEGDSVQRLSNRAEVLTSDILPAVFTAMFGSLDCTDGRWPEIRIGDFVNGFVGGRSLADGAPELVGGLRVLKISAVTSGRFDPRESKPTPADHNPEPHHYVQPGDLLISRANTEELVGATALVQQCPPNVLLPDKLWRFVWKEPAEISVEFMSVQRCPVACHRYAINSGRSSRS